MREADLLRWLLDGDPAVRWQVLRDLAGASAHTVAAERARVATEGWGRRLLERQGPDGRWSADRGPAAYRGLYIPKWTSTTYTLLLLRRLGLPATDERARAGCRVLVEGAEWFPSGGLGFFQARRLAEPCVSAMVLSILEAFACQPEARLRLTRYLLSEQAEDGGWNCRPGAHHSAFATTCAALEALQRRGPPERQARAAIRAREFLLLHQLCCSHRTGRLAGARFLRLGTPIGWQYDVLRGLELFAGSGAQRDPRLEKGLGVVLARRRRDGRWDGLAPPAGALHFTLEPPGQPSRWTTLRCLRVLRWWERGRQPTSNGGAGLPEPEAMH